MTAMTAAQRAQRDAGNLSASEPARHERHENVTIQERDAPDVSSRECAAIIRDSMTPTEPPTDMVCGDCVSLEDMAERGPLSVYSPERWARLQAKGYVWDEDIQRGLLAVSNGTQIGVVVPGDPAYQGVAGTRPGSRTPCEDEVPDVVGMSRYD